MFFIVETRYNIIFAIFIASYYAKNLNYFYIQVVKKILRDIKGFKD